MAYFSNGTEGMMYQERYCNNCVHDIKQDCPVWLAHLLYSYEECNNNGTDGPASNAKAMLDMLIPQREDGFAAQCALFIPITSPQPKRG